MLTKRTLDDIAGDAGAREWKSSRPAAGRGKLKAAWLADAVAKLDQKRMQEKTNGKKPTAKKKPKK